MATHSSVLVWRIPQRSLEGYTAHGVAKKSDTTKPPHTHTHKTTNILLNENFHLKLIYIKKK